MGLEYDTVWRININSIASSKVLNALLLYFYYDARRSV